MRSLVQPQLFRATPEGKWQASLVEPGTDKTGADATSARFRLRRGARWSDGTAISVSDLRRTIDSRFVTAVDEPTARGTIVVHFSQPLPGWRRLWSATQAILPPSDDVYGGPYKVQRVTAGLETVLVANDAYYGAAPRIREVHLVLVPDSEIQARLMHRGDLDVIAPLAFTDRTARLERIKDAAVLRGTRGGWTASLVAHPARLSSQERQTLFALANAPRFVDVLLHDEATATGKPTTAPTDPSLKSGVAVTSSLESAPAGVLLHSMQRAGFKAGRGFDLRRTEFDRVLGDHGAGSFDALFDLEPGVAERCWSCSYASVDPALARAADAGAKSARRALVAKAVSDFLVLPLWRERPVAAVRNGLEGVSLNGFHVAGPAWNLETWSWR